MKRFLVFAYEAYYPGGGWYDFSASFNSSQEAFDHADKLEPKSSGGVEVIDLETETDIYVYRKDREGYLV